MSLEKIAEIAKEKITEIDEAKKKAESLKHAAESSPEIKAEEEKKKAQEAEKAKETEKQKAEEEKLKSDYDEKILKADEAKLNDAEKKRKAELSEKHKGDVQRRIDELVSEIKSLKDSTAKEREENELFKKELAEIRIQQNKAPVDQVQSIIQEKETNRIREYLEKDKSLPREQRREMSKEELSDWLLEDLDAATDWKAERMYRRNKEREKDLSSIHTEKQNQEIKKMQQESFKRVFKDNQNIFTEGTDENKILVEIASKHPEWNTDPDAPEKAVAEVNKVLNSNRVKTEDSEIETLRNKVAELERRAAVDTGLSSSRNNPLMVKTGKPEFSEEQIKISAKAWHCSPEEAVKKLAFHKERRAKITGANVYVNPDEER